ncbi:MAG: hypothetical protein AB4426_30435 [Xenococcaceae cyanobacterium]
MRKTLFLAVLSYLSMYGCSVFSQPQISKEALMDIATNLVTQKFENSSCQELSQMQSQPTAEGPEGAIKQKAIEMLRANPEMREEFINRVAGPIANKMFECELIP